MAYVIPDNLRSKRDLPAGIKHVVGAFETGLDETATAWFEPPYAPQSNPPHFVVLLPDRGIVVLEVLEVRSTGLLGVFKGKLRIQRDDVETEIDNPLSRADERGRELRRVVEAESRLRGFKVPIASGAIFPNLERSEAEQKGLQRQIALDKCIFKSEVTTAIQNSGSHALLAAFNRILGIEGLLEPIPADKEKVLRGLIRPELVIDNMRPSTSTSTQLTIFRHPTDGEDMIRIMDRQQEALAKNLGSGHRVIRGVAGSGKTLILVFRARMLAQANRTKRVLVTGFNKTLIGELRSMLAAETNVDVDNVHRIMAQAIRAARLTAPSFEEQGGERYAEIAVQAVQSGAGPRYAAVLLDEAQDFGTNGLRFVAGLLESGSDDLVIVADAAQNIYKRKSSWSDAGIQARGRTRILRRNYRNTREILEYASKFLLASSVLHAELVPDFDDENAIIPPEAAERSGASPKTVVVADSDAEAASVVAAVRQITADTQRPKTVAVLYTSGQDDRGNISSSIYRALSEAGMNAFWVKDDESKKMLAHTKHPIVLSTIHSAKGLEFPHVVLCNISRDDGEAEANRKLVYVGMTRATETLTVIARQNCPYLSDLGR